LFFNVDQARPNGLAGRDIMSLPTGQAGIYIAVCEWYAHDGYILRNSTNIKHIKSL
jgi:hypothetical protein